MQEGSEEAEGNLAEAEIILRKRGLSSAAKKSGRATRQGVIASYIHPGSQLGVLVEVNCESDFVARTADFQELVKDIAMQVAAADPQFIRREDVTKEALDKEMDIQRGRAKQEGKPDKMIEKIVEGRMNKYLRRSVPLRAAVHQRKHDHCRRPHQGENRQAGREHFSFPFCALQSRRSGADRRNGRDCSSERVITA